MSIPKSFLLDIGGKELLMFGAVLDLVMDVACVWFVLKAKEREQCLFATSLTGATIQDGGKRERSDDQVMTLFCL